MFSCHGQVRYVKRVFVSNTGESYRVWRPVYIDAVKGDSGSDNSCHLYGVYYCFF